MAHITLWYGTRNVVREDYDILEIDGEEIGAVEFADEDAVIEYRIFEAVDGSIFIHNVVRQGEETVGDIDVYDSIFDAAGDYKFVLTKAGVF